MGKPRLRDASEAVLAETATLREAIAAIDRGSAQVAVAVGEDGRLQGLLTDGDARRAILGGALLDAPVAPILNRRPITLGSDASEADLQRVMNAESRIFRVPAVGEDGRFLGLYMIEDALPPEPSRTPVVLMAGGMGQRLRPYTEALPKPLVAINGKPMLERMIEALRDQGFGEFHIAVRYLGEKIIAHFGDGAAFGVRIHYARETQPCGTAGALRLLRDRLDRPFLVMNGDIVTRADFRNLVAYHTDTGALGTMCVREHRIEVPYGVVAQEGGRLVALQEKPVLSHFINAGIYVLEPETLDHLDPEGVFDMTRLFERLALAHPERTAIYPLREYWRDVGTPQDLEAVAEELRLFEDA